MLVKKHYLKHLILLLTFLSMLLFVVSFVHADEVDNDHRIQSRMEQLEKEIELRRSIGFRSDIEYVQAVHGLDSVVIKERLGGVAFTPEEAKELETRIDLERDGETLQVFFAQEADLQEVFGGIYLYHAPDSEDYTAGGKLILQLVQNHEKIDDIVKTLPPLGYPERLQIELADFSNKHLEQQYQEISSSASAYPEIRGVFVDRTGNRIGVLILPSDTWDKTNGVVNKDSLSSELAALVADPSVVVREGEVEETITAVRGGDSWGTFSGGSRCTLGFKVIYNNTYSMLTAGHCVDDLSSGQNIYNSTTHIGTYSGAYKDGASSSSGTGIDAGILYMNNQWTAYDDVINYTSYRDIHGSTSNYMAGSWRCWTGKASGTQCGYIKCESLTYSTTGGTWYTDLFSIDPPSSGGDSGAPAYRPETSSNASVTGIMRSTVNGFGCTNGSDAILSKWHHIRDYFGLTLVTDG
ncbi:MAG: hypothetical protein IT327_06495 [Anaerolineae bacterium]|nr:hypothetical protein [Anaerolineae bacterium]